MSGRVIVVGGGLAGLACSVRLHEGGREVVVLEKSDDVGGRVKTDVVDGFLLDRGFQVYLSAYPKAGKILDLGALQLKKFRPGALVFRGGKLRRVMDVFRVPQHLFSSAFAPVGSLRDKLLVAKLRWKLKGKTWEEMVGDEEVTTEDWLREFGFSEGMIDTFFRSFYGGIFLERGLQTSSRMFEFTFKMFANGHATLPAKGMGEIPKQLAGRLPTGTIRTGVAVTSVTSKRVETAGGEHFEADAVVVATDALAAGRLVPGISESAAGWRSVTCLYFAAKESPLAEAIIALDGSGGGLVNNVCCLSDVSEAYAPKGSALISVSVLGVRDRADLEGEVQEELVAWFGSQVRAWKHLRTDRIAKALPVQAAGIGIGEGKGFVEREGIYVCGDHRWSASIEGAIRSGESAAGAVLARIKIG